MFKKKILSVILAVLAMTGAGIALTACGGSKPPKFTASLNIETNNGAHAVIDGKLEKGSWAEDFSLNQIDTANGQGWQNLAPEFEYNKKDKTYQEIVFSFTVKNLVQDSLMYVEFSCVEDQTGGKLTVFDYCDHNERVGLEYDQQAKCEIEVFVDNPPRGSTLDLQMNLKLDTIYYDSHYPNLTFAEDPDLSWWPGVSVKGSEQGKEAKSIVVPESVVYNGKKMHVAKIEANGFADFSNLESIELPDSIRTFGDAAFQNCSALRSIVIPKSGQIIFEPHGDKMQSVITFSGCTNLETVIIHANTLIVKLQSSYSSGVSLVGPFANSGVKRLIIGPNLVWINGGLFANCTTLREIDFSNAKSLQGLLYGVFYGCTGLTELELPNSIEELGSDVFGDATSLNLPYLPENLQRVGRGCFSGSAITQALFSDKVTQIAPSAFSGCTSLKNIRLPENADYTKIESYTFYGCSNLENFEIPSNITLIGSCAFEGCTKISEITLPASLQSIFNEEGGVQIPAIASRAFSGCSSLQAVYIDSVSVATNDGSLNSKTGQMGAFLTNNLRTIKVYILKGITPGSYIINLGSTPKEKDIEHDGKLYDCYYL